MKQKTTVASRHGGNSKPRSRESETKPFESLFEPARDLAHVNDVYTKVLPSFSSASTTAIIAPAVISEVFETRTPELCTLQRGSRAAAANQR